MKCLLILSLFYLMYGTSITLVSASSSSEFKVIPGAGIRAYNQEQDIRYGMSPANGRPKGRSRFIRVFGTNNAPRFPNSIRESEEPLALPVSELAPSRFRQQPKTTTTSSTTTTTTTTTTRRPAIVRTAATTPKPTTSGPVVTPAAPRFKYRYAEQQSMAPYETRYQPIGKAFDRQMTCSCSCSPSFF